MNETRSGTVVPLESVLVSIDLKGDVAYVSYEGASGIRWEEVSRAHGELVARLGAHAQVQLGHGALIDVGSTVHGARRSA